MYSIFGDESYDEKKERIFAIGTVFGSEQDWAAVKHAWLERTCGIPIHAAELQSDRGYFENQSHAENEHLYIDLINIITNSRIMGCAVSLDIRKFWKIFPNAVKEQPYFVCFNETLQRCFEYLSSKNLSITEIVFDSHPKNETSAGMLYDALMNSEECKNSFERPEIISFAMRDRFIGLQVADIFAREMMKALDNRQLGMPRKTRKSMLVLDETKRFDLTHIEEEYLIGLRDHLMKSEEFQAKWAGYEAWLRQKGLKDNTGARFLYTAEQRRGKLS